jgi:hypothetical protein
MKKEIDPVLRNLLEAARAAYDHLDTYGIVEGDAREMERQQKVFDLLRRAIKAGEEACGFSDGVDELVREFGEEHRTLIESTVNWLSQHDPRWGLSSLIDRRAMIGERVNKSKEVRKYSKVSEGLRNAFVNRASGPFTVLVVREKGRERAVMTEAEILAMSEESDIISIVFCLD